MSGMLTPVICCSDYILNELAKGIYVGAVLVDLKKPFDRVDDRILLKKFIFVLSFTMYSF